jgi:hypothetical protein
LVPAQAAAGIDRIFASYSSMRATLSDTRIDLHGDTATVTSRRRFDMITKGRGNQALHADASVTLTMRRSGVSWVIESITAR